MITKGRWAYWQIDTPMPDVLTVYEGPWEARTKVGTITRYQAMAFYRHWQNSGVYYSVKWRDNRWIDIRLVGDIDAFYGVDAR